VTRNSQPTHIGKPLGARLKNERQCKLDGIFVLPTREKMIANTHCTHWQAPRADAQSKAYQRVQFLPTPRFQKITRNSTYWRILDFKY
jgi:hypothetical protein